MDDSIVVAIIELMIPMEDWLMPTLSSNSLQLHLKHTIICHNYGGW